MKVYKDYFINIYIYNKMTLANLTEEQKAERKKEYHKKYAKAYYQVIKKDEPEKYKERIEKERVKSNARYAKKKQEQNINTNDKPQKKRGIKINLENNIV
jgi:hypothetical protein